MEKTALFLVPSEAARGAPSPEKLKENNEKFGRALRSIRLQKNMSVGACAKVLGSSDLQVRSWEAGQGFPQLGSVAEQRLQELAAGLKRPAMKQFQRTLFCFKPPLEGKFVGPRYEISKYNRVPIKEGWHWGFGDLAVEDGFTAQTLAERIPAEGVGKDGLSRTTLTATTIGKYMRGEMKPSAEVHVLLCAVIPDLEKVKVGKLRKGGPSVGPLGTDQKGRAPRMKRAEVRNAPAGTAAVAATPTTASVAPEPAAQPRPAPEPVATPRRHTPRTESRRTRRPRAPTPQPTAQAEVVEVAVVKNPTQPGTSLKLVLQNRIKVIVPSGVVSERTARFLRQLNKR